MKKPDSVVLHSTMDTTRLEISTHDTSLFLFQLILVLLPFFAIEFFLVQPDTLVSISIFILGISGIGYWILSNFMGKYEVSINPSEVIFQSGFLAKSILKVELDGIKSFKVNRRTGKSITSGRSGVTTIGPNVSDYYIVTTQEEYLMTPQLTAKEKEFIRFKIEESLIKKG